MSDVFLFALLAALNPTLLAATTVILLLPSPKRLLLGYLLGAYTTGITVGLAVEYWLHDSGVVSTTKHTVAPVVDLTLGLLLLLVAFVVGTGRSAERKKRKAEKNAGRPKKTPAWQRRLSKGTARSTYVVGVLLSFPGGSYLASLTALSKQNLGAAETVLTVIAVNVVMLTLLEVPLIGYSIAPEWTSGAIERLKGWFGRNGHRAVVIGATAFGLALIIRGAIQYWG